ncbi:hypothetical protein H0H93_009168 [Arthromyces matolae]|nr:hypothetical protein H0H93_009168 [Arthromyces matolae]
MNIVQALLVLSVLSFTTNAHPATLPFISLPLRHPPPTNAPSQLPPAIVHQQHTNRALRRLDYMTASLNPVSDDQLLQNLARRAAALPPHIQKRYYTPALQDLARLAAQHGDHSKNSPAVNASEFLIDTYPDGVMPAKTPKFKNTIGLEIQSVLTFYHCFQPSLTPRPRSQDGTHTYLGPNSSSTFYDTQKPWKITYGTGDVSGTLVRDTVSIAGLNITNHTFGVAHKESAEFTLDYIPFDGLLGLAKKQISRQLVPTLLEALVSTGKLKQLIVSYHIPRFADGKNKNNGELTLGAMNPARYDPKTLVTVPNVSQLGFWEAKLQDVVVNGKSMGWKNNRTAIFDTGTTLLLAPPTDVNAIHAHIPNATFHSDLQLWTVPCVVPKNAKSIFSLTIGGRSFSVDSRDLAFLPIDAANPKGECQSGISAGMIGGPQEWLVGDVFLKNVYMSTNEGTDKISFANLKN